MKPTQAPITAARISETVGSATYSDTTSMVRLLMVETPTARPSSPSIRLTALVQATIHSMVTGIESQVVFRKVVPPVGVKLEMASTTMPKRIAIPAASICPASLIQALSVTISSSAPMTAMTIVPRSRPMTCVDISTNSSSDRTKPRKIASPPMRGIGLECMRRSSRGTSIAPTASAKRLTGGVIT